MLLKEMMGKSLNDLNARGAAKSLSLSQEEPTQQTAISVCVFMCVCVCARMYTTHKQIQLLKFSHFHRTIEKHSSYPKKETLSFVLLPCMHYALSNPSCISVCLHMPHCKWSVQTVMVLRTVGAGLPCKQQTAVLTIPHSPLIRFKTALSPAVLFHA